MGKTPTNTYGNKGKKKAKKPTIKGPVDSDVAINNMDANRNDDLPKKKKPKTKKKPSEEPFEYLPDRNPFYVEEEAYLYHNPPLPTDPLLNGILPKDLRPIPPPPPLPCPPQSNTCTWTFDELNRVYHAELSLPMGNTSFVMEAQDKTFLLYLMERNDVTQSWKD